MEACYASQGAYPPEHYHPYQDEYFEVRKGQLQVRLNGWEYTFQAGQTIDIPRGTAHTMHNGGSTEARVIWQVRPAIQTQAFYETLFGLAADGRTNQHGIPNLLQQAVLLYRVQSWVLERLTAIQPDAFSTYREKMRDIETLDPLARLYREREVQDAFTHDYNLLARHYRLILLFDTVELIQDTPLVEFIVELAAGLKNTLLLIAGRRNDEPGLVERLKVNFRTSQVLTLKLGGFTEAETDLYFAQAVTSLREISNDLRKNIYLLSNGSPIKIGLSLKWLDQGIPLMPELTGMQPEELAGLSANSLADFRVRFEYALMDGIRQLQSPVDEVILYMAYLHKRFNRRMLEFFFLKDLPEPVRSQQATELVAHLRDLPFVKYISDDYFVLHDEMTRLVKEHVWDAVEDPDKTLRRKLSREACAFYQQELVTFPPVLKRTEQERITFWSYQVEQMYYRLYADFRSGYEQFETLFEQLVEDQRPSLAGLAVSFLREFRDEASFSPLLVCFVEGYYDGGVLLSQQKFSEAEQVLKVGEVRLNEITKMVDPSRAGLLDQHLRERYYLVYNQLGYCYRSLGDWENALRNYERALMLTKALVEQFDEAAAPASPKRQLIAEIATILNNLANVHRLAGRFQPARLLCQTSLLIRKAHAPDLVARSQYVMAMILWEMGATAEAVGYLKKAQELCPDKDETTLALIKKYHAYILFRAGLPEEAITLLEEVEKTLRRLGQLSELADALNLHSRLYRDHSDVFTNRLAGRHHMEVAEQLLNEAYASARPTGDEFRLTKCYLTQAFTAFTDQLTAAARCKPATLVRTMDLIYERLMSLPPNVLPQYTGKIEAVWKEKQEPFSKFPIVVTMCQEAVQYRPYVQSETN